MLVDYEFYTIEYLHGDTPIISEQSFPRLAEMAFEVINFKNIDYDSEPPIRLKKLICEIAEKLFIREQSQSGLDSDGEAIIKSFSNKGYSETYLMQFEIYANMLKSDFDSELSNIIIKRLWNTELFNLFVYAGAR